ncbi:hypothetical protein INQ51_10820 [Maribellus sp. CM-23]|uniref:sialate O-acetylesterase n=1 Tax=Maribellus sp. CM-23 TaxID=2781026 RepID=UPI00397E6FD5|nr:hypothetical protein [Maribellus sp. CM-23]
MQGERDARLNYESAYEQSIKGLYGQVSTDLGRTDVNFIIGRLSNWDLKKDYPGWDKIREIQVNKIK